MALPAVAVICIGISMTCLFAVRWVDVSIDGRFIGIVGGAEGGRAFSATSGDDTLLSEKREPAESL